MSASSILSEINSCRAILSNLYTVLNNAKEDMNNLKIEKTNYQKIFDDIDESLFFQKGKLNDLKGINPNLIFVQKCYDTNTDIIDNDVNFNINNQIYDILENFKNAEIKLINKIDDTKSQINYYENRLQSLQAAYQRAREEEARKCQG